MDVKIEGYSCGRRMVALSFDERARDKAVEQGLSSVYVADGSAVLLPEAVPLSIGGTGMEELAKYGSYDVCVIRDDGSMRRVYSDKSGDNCFFVTGRCNSNCIMCPSPESARRNVPEADVAGLMELARCIPSDTPHLTVTGGEPFLPGEEIFSFVRLLKERFPWTEFLFLTNGRIFAMEKYARLLEETLPNNSVVAIPVHGSCSEVHDRITRSEGSFEQTRQGIRRLLGKGIRVELRIVVSRLNVDDFASIADLVVGQFEGVEYVSVMAMEMTGNARRNKEQVWIPYGESFSMISGALRKLVGAGVDVRLYNFPLCTVEKPFWTLCEKSISPSKVRFAEECGGCRQRNACGGVFAGTLRLEEEELRAL